MGQGGSSHRQAQPFPVPINAPGFQPMYDSGFGYSSGGRSKKGKARAASYPGPGYMPGDMPYPYPYPGPYAPLQNPGFIPQRGIPQGQGFIPPPPPNAEHLSHPDPTRLANVGRGDTTARPRRSSMRQSTADPAPTSILNSTRTQSRQIPTVAREDAQDEPPLPSVPDPVIPGRATVHSSSHGLLNTNTHNPLPSPPKDLYETSPYHSLLYDLPRNAELLSRSNTTVTVDPDRRGTFGKKKSKRSGGLFHSVSYGGSTRRSQEPSYFPGGFYGAPPGDQATTQGQNGVPAPSVPPPPPVPQPSTSAHNTPSRPPSRAAVPPVRFDHAGSLSGFLNHSPHRVLYNNQTYPTVTHLHEAMKYLPARPDVADKIRKVKAVHEVYPVSATLQKHMRKDWGGVFLPSMQEALYLKFKQHPNLRDQLMGTGIADIIYAEPGDVYWGEGPDGKGANQLGKALVAVRERLRAEGYGPPGG